MQIPVKIISISEVRRGVSATTGKPWAQHNVLLGFEDETGESYISAQVSEEVRLLLNLQEGETKELNLKFRTNKFRSGFVANDIRIMNPANLQQP